MLAIVGRRLRRPLVRPLSSFSTSLAEPGASYAHVTRTSALTPTVRLLELRIAEQQVPQHFVPGQWIDLFIPDQPTVGGYSICSVPTELPLIRLAVKSSHYPPTKWCYSQAEVGDEVQVRVGGTFGLSAAGPTGSWHDTSSLPASDPRTSSSSSSSANTTGAGAVAPTAESPTTASSSAADIATAATTAAARAPKRIAKRTAFGAHEQCKRLVLIAGGIGITPLYSILTHLGRLLGHGDSERGGCGSSSNGGEAPWRPDEVHLLYGARSRSELAFEADLTALAQKCAPRLHVTFVAPYVNPEVGSSMGGSGRSANGTGGETEQPKGTRDALNSSSSSSSSVRGVSWVRGDKLSADVVARVVNGENGSGSELDVGRNDKAPPTPPVCLLCGPPDMVDAVEAACWNAGVPLENVIYERWW